MSPKLPLKNAGPQTSRLWPQFVSYTILNQTNGGVKLVIFSSSGLSGRWAIAMVSCPSSVCMSVCLSVHTRCFFSLICWPIMILFILWDSPTRQLCRMYKWKGQWLRSSCGSILEVPLYTLDLETLELTIRAYEMKPRFEDAGSDYWFIYF